MYRIAGNFRWCKFSRKSVQTLQKKFFAVFIFADVRHSGHTPISWWPCPICGTALNDVASYPGSWGGWREPGCEAMNDEVKKQACATTAWSSFCVDAFEITKVSRLLLRARNRRVGFSTADLNFDNFRASHGFVGILYSSRLILLYSNHLEGRQTVENHLVHIGTNSYRHTHVTTSSISILVFFLRFLFSRNQVCPRKSQKFALSENFPLYSI